MQEELVTLPSVSQSDLRRGMPENLVKRGVKFGRSCLGCVTHGQLPDLAICNFTSVNILLGKAEVGWDCTSERKIAKFRSV